MVDIILSMLLHQGKKQQKAAFTRYTVSEHENPNFCLRVCRNFPVNNNKNHYLHSITGLLNTSDTPKTPTIQHKNQFFFYMMYTKEKLFSIT